MTCDFVGHPVAAEPQATPERGGGAPGRARDRAGPAGARAAAGLAPRRGDPARAGLRRGGPPAARRRSRTWRWSCRRPPRWSGCSTRLLPPDAAGWPHVLDPRGFAAPAWEARKRAAFAAADAALAASGTVSLELAAAGTPMVIAYDANPLTGLDRQAHGRGSTPRRWSTSSPAPGPCRSSSLERCTPELIAPAVERLLADPAAAAAQRRGRRARPCSSSAAAASRRASARRARCWARSRPRLDEALGAGGALTNMHKVVNVGHIIEPIQLVERSAHCAHRARRPQAVKSATVAPSGLGERAPARAAKTWCGVPAAAQTTS